MRILHLLDHSPPRSSSYTRRVMAILRQQRAMGWQTCQLTGPRHGEFVSKTAGDETDHAGVHWHFYRTQADGGRGGQQTLFGAVNLLARRLQHVVQLTRPDLLHAHSPLENALAALRVGRRNGLPVVFEAHAPAPAGPPGSVWCSPDRPHVVADRSHPVRLALPQSWGHFATRAMEAWAAARAGAVITNSEGMRARLQAGGVGARRITVVDDALDLARYAPHGGSGAGRTASGHGQRAALFDPRFDPRFDLLFDARFDPTGDQRRGKQANRRLAPRHLPARLQSASMKPSAGDDAVDTSTPALIGYSFDGGPAAEKDGALLLHAAARLLRTWPATRLLVACDARDASTLQSMARQQGLADRLHLLVRAGAASAGVEQGRRISFSAAPTTALHRMADIVVFPQAAPALAASLVAAPPRRLLEAMARACVVAAADAPAHRTLIEHGRSGVLFAAADAAALADCLGVLLAGRARWPSLRAGARWFIEYHRTWEVCVARYGPVYEKLLEGRRRR